MTPNQRAHPFAVLQPPEHQFQTQARSPKPPTDKNHIPSVCPGPVHSSLSWHLANHRNADSHFALLGGISTDQGHPKLPRCAAKSRQKSIEPSPCALGWQSQAKQKIAGLRTHRGQVAGGTSKRFISNSFRWGAIARQKMRAFQKKVAAHHPVFVGSAANHRGVTTDPAAPGRVTLFQIETRDSKTFRDACDQVPFVVPEYSCHWQPFPLY